MKKADLLTVAQHALTSVPYNRLPPLAKRHKLEIEKSGASPVELLLKHVSHYDESGLSRLLLEISLLESAYRNSGDPDNDVLLSAANMCATHNPINNCGDVVRGFLRRY